MHAKPDFHEPPAAATAAALSLPVPPPVSLSLPPPLPSPTPSPTSATPGRPNRLRLGPALQLLQQAGVALPEPSAISSADWLQAMIDALCDLSSRDALTGLFNRRQFNSALDGEIDRVARVGEPALVLMIDIDHFKRVNDNHGHPAGDQVLKSVAQALQECIRPMDTLARFGGEEFAMILPNCPPTFGRTVAERVRTKVEARSVVIAPGQRINVTVSIGGAFAPQWVRSSAALWVERADQQLYRAKSDGRNRTCLEETADAFVSADEKSLLFGTSQFQDFE